MKILLHIGMSKCGSSALQAYWSGSVFSDAAMVKRVGYAALHGDGRLLWGRDLASLAAVSAHDYVSSHSGKAISGLGGSVRSRVLGEIKALERNFDLLILSNEGWGPHPDDFVDDVVFADKSLDVSVLAYVRPQVEWMNSAWWQWGAWSDVPLAKWVNGNIPKARWGALLDKWSKKSWVKSVDVRLLPADVVKDFLLYSGIAASPGERTNQSLPASVLRLFQHNRRLRPGPHDSAIEFCLARNLKLDVGRTPWVLRPPMVDRLVRAFGEDNRALVEWLSTDDRQTMLGDQRWWDPGAYAERQLSPAVVERMSVQDLESISVAALEAVKRLDCEVRQLRQALHDCQKS